MEITKRIDLLIGEEEDKYLTKGQKEKLPEKLKKKIIAKKKKKNEEVSEDAGIIGCRDCGGRVPVPSTLPAPCTHCGSTIKRKYSFKRSTPGRKRRKARG